MTISRVALQGQVTRAQDFTTIKQNEDNKGMVDQTNFQRQFDQRVDNRLRQVNQGDRAENEGKRFDAKEKAAGAMKGTAAGNARKKIKNRMARCLLKEEAALTSKYNKCRQV